MTSNQFWLFRWLDEHDVKTLSDAEKILSNKARLNNLSEYARSRTDASPASVSGESIVAGRGLDFSGQLDCGHADCRKRQVDLLFRKAWHYFDRVIVADSVSHEVSYHWDAPALDRKRWILPHLSALLYLREIGGEDLVEFREKPAPCEKHLAQHVAEAGIEHVLSVGAQLMPQVLANAQVKFNEGRNEAVNWRFDHPQFEHTQWGTLPKDEVEGRSEEEIRVLIYRSILSWFVANLASDVATARSCEAPLGATIWMHQKLLLESTDEMHPAQVAFNLSLPVLEGISIKQLIDIRREEKAHFDRFRYNLRLAIRERLKINQEGDPTKLAHEIQTDLVEPELAKITVRLNAARTVLAKKSVSNLVVAGFATIVGSYFGLPVVGLALGAALSVGPLHSYFDQVKDIENSDMFFLWKAESRHG